MRRFVAIPTLLLIASPAAAQSTNCLVTPPLVSCESSPAPNYQIPAQGPQAPQAYPQARPQPQEGAFARGQRLARESVTRDRVMKTLKAGDCAGAVQDAAANLMFDLARSIKEFCPSQGQ